MQLLRYDLLCLSDGEFLNDKIINFYLQYINREILTDEQSRSAHFFDTFFYLDLKKCLADEESPPETRWQRIEKYTKNVNIFDKEFIVVPVHQAAHWTVAVICFAYMCDSDIYSTDDMLQVPCILRFNSMRSNETHRGDVFGELRKYLAHEHSVRFPDHSTKVEFTSKTIKGVNVKVPEQRNFYDCGIFLLTYVEKFFTEPIGNFKNLKSMEKWFPIRETLLKRQQIAETIVQLVKVLSPDVEVDISNLKFSNGERRRKPRKSENIDEDDDSPAVMGRRRCRNRVKYTDDEE